MGLIGVKDICGSFRRDCLSPPPLPNCHIMRQILKGSKQDVEAFKNNFNKNERQGAHQ